MTIENFLLPVGRIVSGHPNKPQEKRNQSNNQPVMKDGQKVIQYFCGLAFPKEQFLAEIWPTLQQAGTAVCQNPGSNFSWKFEDGDDPKHAAKQGYAGHYVLKISTEAFQPSIYRFDQAQGYVPMAQEEVKRGDYVRASVTIKGHMSNNDGGIYVNPDGYEFVGYGEAIVSAGANPTNLFGGQPVALPAGASATPTSAAPAGVAAPIGAAAPQAAPAGAMPGMPPQAAPVAAAPQAAPVAAAPAATMPPPATDYPQGVGNAAVAPAVAPQPAQAPQGMPTAQPATSFPTS